MTNEAESVFEGYYALFRRQDGAACPPGLLLLSEKRGDGSFRTKSSVKEYLSKFQAVMKVIAPLKATLGLSARYGVLNGVARNCRQRESITEN